MLENWPWIISTDVAQDTDMANNKKPGYVHKPDRSTPWIWYGWFEGTIGGCVPPDGIWPRALYRSGNIAGLLQGWLTRKRNGHTNA